MHILRIILLSAVILLPLIGGQIALSVCKSKYPGLIVPGAFFLMAILIASFAAKLSSALLAFLLGSIPWILNVALYALCRFLRARRLRKKMT